MRNSQLGQPPPTPITFHSVDDGAGDAAPTVNNLMKENRELKAQLAAALMRKPKMSEEYEGGEVRCIYLYTVIYRRVVSNARIPRSFFDKDSLLRIR